MKALPLPAHVGVAEAATLLAVSTARIRQLCALGVLATQPVDRRTYLVSRASVEAYRQHQPQRGPRPRAHYKQG